MKKFTLFSLLALLLSLAGRAQTFPVDTLIKSGPITNRINLVFVSDGYQANELSTYRADVNRAVSAIFQQPPFLQYRQYFNVFAIRVPSAQSGTTHPGTAVDCYRSSLPVSAVNTYFQTTFDDDNIHRAIVTRAQSALAGVLASNFPLYSVAVVMVNSPEYGGTGDDNSNITITANASAPETMIHEMGHSLGGLADEYWAGPQYAAELPNMTQPAVVSPLRWLSWVGQNGVGNYSFPEAPTWSRPHQNCKMQFLGVPFCSVCIEALIERTHAGARALEGYSPTTTALSNPTQALPFSLSLLQPNPNTLKISWKRDGVIFARNTAQVTVPLAQLAGGSHVIRAEVLDTTALSHSTTHATQHRYVVEWTVQNTGTSTRLSASAAEYKIETYPNPVADVLNVSYTLSRATDVRLVVLDAAGRRVKTLTKARQAAGTYDYQLQSEELNLRAAGVYTLLVEIDGMAFSRQLIKR